jgi:hypothetical protein
MKLLPLLGMLLIISSSAGCLDFLSLGEAGLGDRDSKDSKTSLGKAIENITVYTKTKGANSYTAYTGEIKLWDPEVNPGDANANAVSTSTVAAGTGTIDAKSFGTGDELKLTLDGSSTWYDMLMPTAGDFIVVDEAEGIIKFTTADTTEESVSPEVEFLEIVTITTIDDMLEEGGETDNLSINGQTNTNLSVSTVEIGCADPGCADAGVLIYDESQGDGDWYYKIDIGVTGANTWGEQMALCYEWESGAEPEGNEFSSITVQQISGTDYGMPSELVNYFANEACVQLGSIRGGQSGEYKILYSTTEANLDTNDDFKLTLDDMGGIALKDIHLGSKASSVNIDHDAQA